MAGSARQNHAVTNRSACVFQNSSHSSRRFTEIAKFRPHQKKATATDEDPLDDELEIALSVTERRHGVEMKMVMNDCIAQFDKTLFSNVTLAHRWSQTLKSGQSFQQIADDSSTSKRRVWQIAELAFVAPDIVRDITKGTQPLGFTSDWWMRHALQADRQTQRERIANLAPLHRVSPNWPSETAPKILAHFAP